MNDFEYFKNNTLLPAMYEHADRLFPDMNFSRRGNKWLSPMGMHGRTSKHPRPDKTIITNTQQFGVRILEQGGDNMSIVDYYMAEHNHTQEYFMDAVQELCRILHLDCPKCGDSAEYKAKREKQSALDSVMREMQRALFAPDGLPVLSYLRNARGYTDAEIQEMNMGYCNRASADKLRKLYAGGTPIQNTVGDTHILAIPYMSGGNIVGMLFRAITDEVSPKYTKVFLSKERTNNFYLFGLSGSKVAVHGEHDADLIMVEGEIDALRATINGVPNVVAIANNNVSVEAAHRAKQLGFRRAILLLDYDGEDKQAAQDKKVDAGIGTIRSVGMIPLVASFPHNGAKVDTDSFLAEHTGEELTALAYGAQVGALWQLDRLLAEYDRSSKEDRDFLILIDQINAIAHSGNMQQEELDILFKTAEAQTGGTITKASLCSRYEHMQEIRQNEQIEQNAKRLAANLQKCANDNDIAGFQKMLADGAKQVVKDGKGAAWERILAAPTKEEIDAALTVKKCGIPSGIYFAKYNDEGKQIGESQEWLIPTGALSIIAAPTSHGKSRLLQNMAINMMSNDRDGDILYISLEEDSGAVEKRMINILMGQNISKNNSRTIDEYFASGRNYATGGNIAPLLDAEAALRGRLMSRRMMVKSRAELPTIGSIEDLVFGIDKATKMGDLQAVYIDYMQLITTQAKVYNKKEELAYICDKLMEASTATGLPIILAAQLNRQALSPVDMEVQNIADAANIEHSANSILLLWDSVQKPLPGASSNYERGGSMRLQEMGITLGDGGKLYARLAKCRGMERNLEAVLNYNGNTFRVDLNNKPKNTIYKPQVKKSMRDDYE